jgi:DNA repair protein RecO (recombination protein O)
MTATGERVQLAAGYVLHQRPYRESSALLEVFTEEYGRLGLVARGVRSAKSRQRGELQPFRALRLSWQTRGELGTLTGLEPDGMAPSLHGSALYSAFYLNELLMLLLVRHDPHPGLFATYRDSLQLLAVAEDIEPVLRLFELSLLQEAGYGLQLDSDALSGEPLRPDRFYDYHLESGPVPVAGEVGGAFVFSGASLLAMAHRDLGAPDVLRDAKRLLRSALKLYLGDRPLKSRELFEPLRKQKDGCQPGDTSGREH